jgi:hypothetical protein
MKNYLRTILLAFCCALTLFSQDYQVTKQAPSSVAAPSIDFSNNLIHLAYGTNLFYYSFGVDGPPTPITTPVKPDPLSYGPYTVSMRANGDNRYLTYIDRNVSLQRYDLLFQNSSNGLLWSSPMILETIQKSNSISLRPDNPILRTSAKGNVYCLYLNYSDTNKIFLVRSSGGGNSFNVKTRIAPLDTNLVEKMTLEMQVVAVGGTDNVFVFYSVGANIYMTRSINEGISFSSPAKVGSLDNADFGNFYSLSAALSSAGKIYLVCDQFGQAIPMLNRSKAFIRSSNNYGVDWSTGGTIDTLGYVNPKLLLTNTGTIACIKQRQNNIYILSSKNGITWSDTIRINTVPQKAFKHTVTLIDDNTIGVAWIDTRTGGDEIFYRKMTIPATPVTKVDDISLPSEFMLYQNYPNPFNPTTTISYQLSVSDHVSLKVFDMLGKEVAALVNETNDAGTHSAQFNAANLSSGMYFARLSSSGKTQIRKLLLMK